MLKKKKLLIFWLKKEVQCPEWHGQAAFQSPVGEIMSKTWPELRTVNL